MRCVDVDVDVGALVNVDGDGDVNVAANGPLSDLSTATSPPPSTFTFT